MIIGILCFSMFSFLHLASTSSEAPPIEWSETYGRTRSLDGVGVVSVIQTSDGGYAIASTSDFGTGNDADQRLWLVKTDSVGNAEWNETYGDQRVTASSIIQTNDGGFIILGNLLIGGYGNAWLVKTDPSGNMQWNENYTELGWATAFDFVQTSDGGYVIAGDIQYYQAWLMKTDADGAQQWSRSLGGYNSALYSVIQTSDGGYAATGNIQDPSSGKIDAYIVKTDSEGNIIWSNEFSRTTGNDYGRAIIQTSDGGYAIAGETNHWGNADFWLIKTNASGSLLWDKTFGGAGWDGASSIVQTSDGGYLLAGQTSSFGVGAENLWLVRTDADGNIMWNQTYGGAGDTVPDDIDSPGLGHPLIQTDDQGYALVGYTNSFSADGSYQVWLIKLAPEVFTPPAINILSPQSTSYNVTPVQLTFTVNESTSWMGYSLDNQSNVTISGNTTLAGLSVGQHTIIVYANDTSGNMGSSAVVNFTVVQAKSGGTLPPSLELLGAGSRYVAPTGNSALYIDSEDNYLAHHLTDGSTWPWGSVSIMDDYRSTISSVLEQYGFNVTFAGDIPPTLNGYDLVVLEAYWACEPKYAQIIQNYVYSGGGVVLLSGTPCFFVYYSKTVYTGTDLSSIQEWFGAQTYVNSGGYATAVIDHPGGSSFTIGDTVGFFPGGSAAGTSNPSSDTVVWATWSAGGIFSFVHMYGKGRVYFQAAWTDLAQLTVVSSYGTPNPTSGLYAPGTGITASVTPTVVGPVGVQYVCTGWTGTGDVPVTGTGTTVTFTINQDSSITWNWKTPYNITFDQTGVGSDFTGTVVVIDGTNYNVGELPASFWWYNGSTHMFAFQSSLAVGSGAKEYDWNFTSGLSALQSDSITVTGPGSVTGNYVTKVHDVGVTSVVANRTWVYQGWPVEINVTIKNNGDFNETVNVTLYYNMTAGETVGTQTVPLLVGQSKTIAFTWDTTSVQPHWYYNYTLTAVARIAVDYTPADNTLADGNVTVRMMFDVIGDGKVDGRDITMAARAFGSFGPNFLYPGSPPSPRWNPDLDFLRDDKIDGRDLTMIARHFGQSYPP
jgi:hypothetical protein